MKKAQGLSMNTIIIAALALLVLAVVAMVFMSRSNIFVAESGKCEMNGGLCKEVPTDGSRACPEGMVTAQRDSTMSCKDGFVCCISGERVE